MDNVIRFPQEHVINTFTVQYPQKHEGTAKNDETVIENLK